MLSKKKKKNEFAQRECFQVENFKSKKQKNILMRFSYAIKTFNIKKNFKI